MTLFKRVFNSHTTCKALEQECLHQADDPESELMFDDEIVTGIAIDVGDQAADIPVNYDGQVGALDSPIDLPETAVQPDIVFNPRDLLPQELGPKPVVDQRMAEHAAKAQREIARSQELRRVGHKAAPMLSDEEIAKQAPQEHPAQNDEAAITAPNLAPDRSGRTARRVRTRMLGFDQDLETSADPFEKQKPETTTIAQKYPVGWMVVVAGPGKGNSFAIFNGVSTIGRGVDQTVALDFGDSSVSREKHAAIAYDDESKCFFLGQGGKSNIVRLNNRPVLSTEDLSDGDTVRIGETTLRFVALCGAAFTWGMSCNDET